MIDAEEIRRKWEVDRPHFAAFGRLLYKRLTRAAQRIGVNITVSSRAKDIDSIIKKLIRKPEYSYETLGDKTGVRVVVRHLQEISPMVTLAQKLFACGEPENTADRLAEDRVGYLSTHVDIALRPNDLAAHKFPGDRYHAELQVRTLAQHLWSEMSHDTTYKSGTVVELDLKRRVNLLAGLIEVADREFSRLEVEFSRVESIAEVKLLKALEGEYFRLSARRTDTDLSLEVIRTLLPVYNQPLDAIAAHLKQISEEKHRLFQSIFAEAAESPYNQSVFLFQPEVVMIYDLLHTRQYDLRRTWAQHFPERELERLAITFGISFD